MSAPDHRADQGYSTDQIAAYGASEQPAIAARMAPHLRMTYIGTGCAVLAVVGAAAALISYPSFDERKGFATMLVLRSRSEARLAAAETAVCAMLDATRARLGG